MLAAPRDFRLTGLACRTETSAGVAPLPPSLSHPQADRLRAIFEVGCRTLGNCMQSVFEDGPKRDRRLWLGDLRIQALANYHSFRNYNLVKRCLYLFAGLPCDDGLISGCVYDTAPPVTGNIRLLQFALLLAATVDDYGRATGDWSLADELWPVLVRQVELARGCFDGRSVFVGGKGYWNFVDWNDRLDSQASLHCVTVYCLRRTAELARRLNRADEGHSFDDLADKLVAAARKHLFDQSVGLIVSGLRRQVSYASNAWATIAGVLTRDEAGRAWRRLLGDESAVQPVTPYLWHHVLDAMFQARLDAEATDLMLDYWGGMIDCGATTFWEVFDPADPTRSPYGDHRMNSYCHAWSCGPVYLIGLHLAGG